MSTRNSDDDIRRYLPDLETIYREADPAHAEEKHKKALDNPELDKVLAEIEHKANAAGKHRSELQAAPAQPKAPAVAETAGPAAQSRWASDAEPPIDKALLPSSLLPVLVPPVMSPSPPREVKVAPVSGRRWRIGMFSALAVLAVLAPVITWGVCSMTMRMPSVSPAASSVAAAPASAPAAAPRAAAPAPPPDAGADAGTPASSRAPPEASAPPQPPPRAPVRPVPTARPVAPEMMQ
jgi:hypothetical protein